MNSPKNSTISSGSIAYAESRRNAILHEIDRHRAVLGEMLRQNVQKIEEG
jgi:hypothetical protein